jgi:hypothetical protein
MDEVFSLAPLPFFGRKKVDYCFDSWGSSWLKKIFPEERECDRFKIALDKVPF